MVLLGAFIKFRVNILHRLVQLVQLLVLLLQGQAQLSRVPLGVAQYPFILLYLITSFFQLDNLSR